MKTDLPASLWPALHRIATNEGWPPSSEEAGDRLVREAARHGVLPLLFEEDAMPPSVAGALERNRAWRRIYALRAELLDVALREVDLLLRGEPWLLLKGADYRLRLYPRPWLRPMQDIDILIPLERAEAVWERLKAGGLRESFPGGLATLVRSHHERVFLLGDLPVEVHHSFIQRPRHRVDYGAVWERRVALPAGTLGATRLSDLDAFVHHALSMAVDGFAVPLIRFVDLWLMLRQDPGLVSSAAARAQEWRAVRALYGSLRQALRLIPELRTGELESVARGLASPAVRTVLDRCVLPRVHEPLRERDVGRIRRLWRKYWLMDNLWRRLSFGLYHVAALLHGLWIRRAETARGQSGA